MPEFIIRNDDVSVDIDMQSFVQFCEICDKHRYKIIQCLTPLGETLQVDSRMTNDEIVALGKNKLLVDNKPLYMYLLHRAHEKGDEIAIHGLWHTHRPTVDEIITAKHILNGWGFFPNYFAAPFNEVAGDYGDLESIGLKLTAKCDRLEDFLPGRAKFGQKPTDKIVYLHSWRFFPQSQWYPLNSLDQCLTTITM